MQPIKEILIGVGKDIILSANLESFNSLDTLSVILEFSGPYPDGKESLLAIEDVGIKLKIDDKSYDFWAPESLNTIPSSGTRYYEVPLSTLHTLAFNNFNLLFILAINNFNAESHLRPHREEFEFFLGLLNKYPDEIFNSDLRHYWRALCNRVINVFKKQHTFSNEFSENSRLAILMEMSKLVTYIDEM